MQFNLGCVKDLFEKYKKDLMCVGIIALLFVICSIFTWGYYGNLFYDNGREAYLPQLMLEGKVLFKDIFAMYSPLSYQFNALLYYIFGAKLNVLYLAGTINAFLIAVVLYLISRQFMNKAYSLVIVCFISLFFIFNSVDHTGYILPYSFAFPYAILNMLISVYLALFYLKCKKSHYIIWASLFLGISFAHKPEFILCMIPLLGCIIAQKSGIRTVIYSVIAFLLPNLFSWGLLALQGFGWSDFISYMSFIKAFFATPEQQFYTTLAVKEPLDRVIVELLIDTLMLFITIGIPVIIVKFLVRKKFFYIGILLLLLLAKYYYINLYTLIAIGRFSGSIFAICSVINMFIIYNSFKTRNYALLFLSLAAIFSSARFGIAQTVMGYSIYTLPFILLICWIYYIAYIPKIRDNIKIITSIIILVFGVSIFTIQINKKMSKWILINSPDKYNQFYQHQIFAEPFNESIKWVMENTNENDTVLSLPEGIFINYITKRKTLPMYYHLIPNHITALGEDSIVEGLSQNPPDYVMLNNADYALYGAQYICRDFAYKICDFIVNNYDLAANYYYKDMFFISIYKKK